MFIGIIGIRREFNCQLLMWKT